MNAPQPKYIRDVLFSTESFEVVSITWELNAISPMHNHGWSECHILVEEGDFENRVDLGAKQEVTRVQKGQVVSTPVAAKHEMICKSPTGKTLHVYTPKINVFQSDQFRLSPLTNLEEDLALEDPTEIAVLTKQLEKFRDQSVNTRSPFFMNQLFSGVLPQMLMAEQLVARTRTTLATHEASPIFSAMETEIIDGLGALVPWPVGSRSGICVPGGSAANFMAVHCARQRRLPRVKQTGMAGTTAKIFVSEHAHYSFAKAVVALGLGLENLVKISVDENHRMQPWALDTEIRRCKANGFIPLMVASTAGTTVFGAFDDLGALADICAEHDVWFHVDAAWGGPALFSRELRPLMQGLGRADSLTFDAHKLFGASLTCSFLITSDPEILRLANDVGGGEYLFHSDDSNVDRGLLSWQCGRRADAASLWTIWKSLGTNGLGEFVDRLLKVRNQTLEWIASQPRLELVAAPTYLNICVRVVPPAATDVGDWSKHVRNHLKAADLAMVNFSSDDQGSFLRLILAHPELQFEHVRQILQWSLDVGTETMPRRSTTLHNQI